MSKVIYNADGTEIKPGICWKETIQVPTSTKFDVIGMYNKAALSVHKVGSRINNARRAPGTQLEMWFVDLELREAGIIQTLPDGNI